MNKEREGHHIYPHVSIGALYERCDGVIVFGEVEGYMKRIFRIL